MLIEHAAERVRARWKLTLVESEVIQGQVLDALLERDMRRIRDVQDPAKFVAYLRAIIRNKACGLLRRRVTMTSLSQATPRTIAVADVRPCLNHVPADVPGVPRQVELARTLFCFRRRLTQRQFLVLWLHHVEGVSLARIAKGVRTSRAAVRQAHERALANVRRRK